MLWVSGQLVVYVDLRRVLHYEGEIKTDCQGYYHVNPPESPSLLRLVQSAFR